LVALQRRPLRCNQFSDSFFPEREHFRELVTGKRRFLARPLHLDELSVFCRDQIEIHRHSLVLFVIQIENRNAAKHTGAHRRHQFPNR